LVAIDLPSGVSVVYPIPVAGGGGGLARGRPDLIGRESPRGDEVVVSTGPYIYRYRAGEVVHLTTVDAAVASLAFGSDGESVEAQLSGPSSRGDASSGEAPPEGEAPAAGEAPTVESPPSRRIQVSLETPAAAEARSLSGDDRRLMDAMSRRDGRSE